MTDLKEHILSEIRRLAIEDGGTPPGVQAFRRATGIKESAWRGRCWFNCGQALTANSWTQRIPEEDLLGRLAAHVRELGHYPVDAELKIRRRTDPTLASVEVFRSRFGSTQATADALLRYARKHADTTLASICEERVAAEIRRPQKPRANGSGIGCVGCVYLMKSGQFYKIGLSNSSGRRESELRIQLPERIKLIHEIKTDCPSALENYWHNRFAGKRRNGEWFELDVKDIKAFTRRKQFIFGEMFS